MSINALRNRLVAVYDADVSVQTITGRTSENLILRGDESEIAFPYTTYFFLPFVDRAGISGTRDGTIQLDHWGNRDDNRGALTVISDLETLADRAEALFTGATLNTGSVDVAIGRLRLRSDGFEEDGRTFRIMQEFPVELRE